MDAAKNEELMHLREFHAQIAEAFRLIQERNKRPFFAGQAARRMVREALERYEDWRAHRLYQSVSSPDDPVPRPL